MAFLASFIQYLVIMVILIAIAVGGFMLGKFLRGKKDAKDAAKAEAAGATVSSDEQ